MPNRTVYVKDTQLWIESQALAQSIGISHSEMIERALRLYCLTIIRQQAIQAIRDDAPE